MILRMRATELRESGELIWVSDTVPVDQNVAVDLMGPQALHVRYRPAMLLFGLALEAYVKAALVYQSPEADVQDAMSALPRDGGGHDLLALCKAAGVSINQQEQETLIRLTKSVVWMSKYYAPKQIAQRNPRDLIRKDSDYMTFKAVYDKVTDLLPTPRHAFSD
jgi:hypothetical protein